MDKTDLLTAPLYHVPPISCAARVQFYDANGCSYWLDGDEVDAQTLNYAWDVRYNGGPPSSPQDIGDAAHWDPYLTYQVAPLPPTPGGLHVTGHTATTVSLAWTPDPGNPGYQVAANGTELTADWGLGEPYVSYSGASCTIYGLASGTSYQFKVAEYGDMNVLLGGFSPQTDPVVTDSVAPATPIAVNSAISPGYYYFANVDPPMLELMWDDASGDETGFELEISTFSTVTNPNNPPAIDLDADTSEYIDSAVTPGTNYYCWVRAFIDGPSGRLYSGWQALNQGRAIDPAS